jgi:hypothetical protein
MIPRTFNAIPTSVKVIEIICKIRQLVLKYQYYNTNNIFVCNFDLLL